MIERLTDEGVARLQVALDRAESDRSKFSMETFFATTVDDGDLDQLPIGEVDVNICGTRACLAGNIVLTDRRYVVRSTVQQRADHPSHPWNEIDVVDLVDLRPVTWERAALRSLGLSREPFIDDDEDDDGLWGAFYSLFYKTDWNLDQVWIRANELAGFRLNIPTRLLGLTVEDAETEEYDLND